MLIFSSISWIVHVLLILLSVAFFTLFERKVMGLFHARVGPNKVSFIGILQPLLDAFKLLMKQTLTPLSSNKLIYALAPLFSLFLSVYMWSFMHIFFSYSTSSYSFLMFFCISSFMVFPVLLSGWSSNSKYTLIGSLRSIAQSVSYESVFSTVLVSFLFLVPSFSIVSYSESSSLFFILWFPLWLICTLAETHRAPFDFSEAESELVSGFNTEYSGAYFAFIFLSEYSVLLFSCVLMVYMFFGFLGGSYFYSISLSMLLSFLFIWIRITFCRFRYDKLMAFCWKTLLPFSLALFIIFICLSSI